MLPNTPLRLLRAADGRGVQHAEAERVAVQAAAGARAGPVPQQGHIVPKGHRPQVRALPWLA